MCDTLRSYELGLEVNWTKKKFYVFDNSLMSLVEDVYLCDSVFKLWSGKGTTDTAALCCYRCLWSWTS